MEGVEEEKTIQLVCVKEGGKLRVKITSPGYLNSANCQFPRKIRAEGKRYSVPSSGVSLKQGPRGKYYYKISASKILTHEEVSKPEKVFGDDDDPVCVICMDLPKNLVFVPCGHYCCCAECTTSLKSTCPLCRGTFTSAIDRSMIG
jgi:Zinc finger, C3HC4 type (RING finger)